MQISTDGYFHDRQRHDLALRMIRHEARNSTIRACTGLTDDRIRRLFKTYRRHETAAVVRRRRGKSPGQTAYFTRNVHMHFEASCLGSLFAAFGLLRTLIPREKQDPQIAFGERFCDAYETHRQLLRSPRISMEHAWFLLRLLNNGAQLQASRCRHCSSHYLRDPLNAVDRHCPFCALRSTSPCIKGRRNRSRRCNTQHTQALLDSRSHGLVPCNPESARRSVSRTPCATAQGRSAAARGTE